MSIQQQIVAGYPKDEYDDTQNTSTEQQNEAQYIKSEYGTHKPSAAALIRAQGEQIRRMSAEEYLKDKSRETEVFCRKYRQKQEEKEYTRSN